MRPRPFESGIVGCFIHFGRTGNFYRHTEATVHIGRAAFDSETVQAIPLLLREVLDY